jgi:hypothetical protein
MWFGTRQAFRWEAAPWTWQPRLALLRRTIMSTQAPFRIAVLDDYQNVALTMADWSVLDGRASVTVFNDHLARSAGGGR